MANLYANENVPLQVVEALRRMEHDVLTVREAGQDNQRIDDARVLEFASAAARALITINRHDFIKLHHQQPTHQLSIICTEDPDVKRQAQRIHDALRELSTLDGVLIPVNHLSK